MLWRLLFPLAALAVATVSVLSGALAPVTAGPAAPQSLLALSLLLLLGLSLYLLMRSRIQQQDQLRLRDDLSRLQRYKEQFFYEANFDRLTGLPKRELMLDRLTQAIASAERHHGPVTLLLVDLDGIKHVNESLGHGYGDELIVEASRRLTHCVREEDSVARLGGDKFLVMLANLRSSDDATLVSSKIIESISRPFLVERHELSVSVNIGMTVYPDDGGDAMTLLRNANAALGIAKHRGSNVYHFFTAEMTRRAMERLDIQTELRQAISRQELSLFYQPVMRISSGTVDAAEVLLRWNSSELGEIGPERFIPVSEDSGLIIPIGRWLLQQACAECAGWLHSGLPPVRLAVNVSSQQFVGNNIVLAVTEALDVTGLDASMLELEITEGMLLVDAPQTRQTLKQLKSLGLRLSLDDFGTGYASVAYLRRYAFDVLKIDRSFIQEMDESEEASALVEAITAMAHSLELEVVAEGVESPLQADTVRRLGCDFAQGYFYGRPMPAHEFGAWLEHYQSGRERDRRGCNGD